MMAERVFEKCLKTEIRTSPEKQVTYILPYTGYLTDAKYDQLAGRFAKKVAHLFEPNFTFDEVRSALFARLKSTWYTGREKDVQIEPDEFGAYSLKGENWFAFGYKADDFVIVE